MTVHDPLALFLLPVAVILLYFSRGKNESSALRFSSGELLSGLRSSFKLRVSRGMIFLRMLAITLLIVALARPQSPVAQSRIHSEGIDICLAIDCSGSMLAEDFSVAGRRQSRIEAVKAVVRDFIKGRQNDRIGIVAFAARAYTVCPLTLDYSWLLQNLERVRVGSIEDGTAIGSGVASSLNRLKGTKAKSKVIILLTDGRNNTGNISPLTAAEAARALKVKVYTIGAGAKGQVPFPAKDFFGNTVYQMIDVDVDEDTLGKIASITDARYFRATDTASLKEIYRAIDKLEKTRIEEKGYQESNELFGYFLIPGLVLIFMEILLGNTWLRKIP